MSWIRFFSAISSSSFFAFSILYLSLCKSSSFSIKRFLSRFNSDTLLIFSISLASLKFSNLFFSSFLNSSSCIAFICLFINSPSLIFISRSCKRFISFSFIWSLITFALCNLFLFLSFSTSSWYFNSFSLSNSIIKSSFLSLSLKSFSIFICSRFCKSLIETTLAYFNNWSISLVASKAFSLALFAADNIEFPWSFFSLSPWVKGYFGLFLSICFNCSIWAFALANWQFFCWVKIFWRFWNSSSALIRAFCFIRS